MNELPPDEYERRYMGADEALARERVRMAWWGHAIFLAALAWALESAVARHDFLSLILPLILISIVWLVFSTLRVAVTRAAVHVQLGVFGPKIAIGDIERAEVARGSIVRMGWGLRYGLDGTVTYSVPSAARDYLRIVYKRGRGRRVVRVMSADPGRLVRAIEVARGKADGLRVASSMDVAEPLASEEEELAASSVGERDSAQKQR
jgi:hypothetical protein